MYNLAPRLHFDSMGPSEISLALNSYLMRITPSMCVMKANIHVSPICIVECNRIFYLLAASVE